MTPIPWPLLLGIIALGTSIGAFTAAWAALPGRRPSPGTRTGFAAATAALYGLLAWRHGLAPDLPADLYLATITPALAAIDIREHRLPNKIIIPSYLATALLLPAGAISSGQWGALGRALLAATAIITGFLALALATHGGIGAGDVRLAGLLGLALGYVGWRTALIGIVAGFAYGATVGAILILARRATTRTQIPFGPALLAGAFTSLALTF